ncbi:dihydrofolate reductase [Ruicaihuangia caeni]|uniref:dihydrofolate reductase n=1 Tax=Ruicaihuangia caeni TaxID=3042517 RepID=UPI00338ED945
MLGLIWAQARGRVIGAQGTMPWHLPEDLAHFRRTTMGSPVIMGRRTWESFPEKFRPLPGRRNIVVTRRTDWADAGAERADSLDAAIALAGEQPTVWVIGGGQLYRDAIGLADRLVVTELDLEVEGDTLAPEIGAEWALQHREPDAGWHTAANGIRYRFCTYERA